MSAPKRYLEDGPSRARDLLSHAKSTPALPAATAAASAASVAKLATAKAGKMLLLKGMLGVLALGLVVGALQVFGGEPSAEGVVAAPTGQPEPTSAEAEERAEAPPERAVAPAVEQAEAAVEQAEAAVAEQAEAAVAETLPLRPVGEQEEAVAEAPAESSISAERPGEEAPPEASADTLAEEVALLEQARRLLGVDPAAALARAREHRREYPRGQFAAAAELVEIDALLRLGRRGEAVESARAMAERRPSSLYRDRLVSLVGEEALR